MSTLWDNYEIKIWFIALLKNKNKNESKGWLGLPSQYY
jgi:hypothetical protein